MELCAQNRVRLQGITSGSALSPRTIGGAGAAGVMADGTVAQTGRGPLTIDNPFCTLPEQRCDRAGQRVLQEAAGERGTVA